MKDLVDYFSGVETDVRLFMLIILLPLVLINYVSLLNLSPLMLKLKPPTFDSPLPALSD